MNENVVRIALDRLGLSVADFAKLVGVTPRAVNLWLGSQREIPGPAQAYIRLILSLPPYLRLQEIENSLRERKKSMKPYKYKFMLWQLIAACDSGDYDALTIDEVEHNAKIGTIASFMIEKFGREYDFSIFEASDWTQIEETWGNIAVVVDPSRKFGVDRKGICLLLAYALEGLQQLDSETRIAEEKSS